MKIHKKDWWTIPNLMGYARILLIPFFVYFYLQEQYTIAGMLVLISTFSDLFDGMIARKFNMVTDLGKIIDPLADKLTHAAMGICLLFRYPLMILCMILMACKECYMAIKGIQFLKQGKMMNGASHKGKICTACLFICMFVLFFFYNIPVWLANTLIVLCMIVMMDTWIYYIRFYKGWSHA